MEVSIGLMKDSFSDSKGEIQSQDSSEPCLMWKAAGMPGDGVALGETVALITPQAKPALLGTFHLHQPGGKKTLFFFVRFSFTLHREAI